MTATFLQFWLTLRTYLLVSSKVIFILLSFWYLFQHRLFSISFNLPYIKNIWLLNKVVSFMETLGVGIIIIPLVIVIMSFFYESKILNFFATFFSLSGNIFSLYQTISQNLLEEKFKVGFLTLYNNISYEKKVSAFKHVFEEKITLNAAKVANPSDYENYVQTIVSREWLKYLDHIKTLGVEHVQLYASKIATNIAKAYNEQLSPMILNCNTKSTWWDLLSTFSISGGKIVGIIVVSVIGYWMYSKIVENAKLSKDIIANQKDYGTIQSNVVQNQSVTDTVLLEGAATSDTTASNIKIISDNLAQLRIDCNHLTETVTNNSEIQKEVIQGPIKQTLDQLTELQNRLVSLENSSTVNKIVNNADINQNSEITEIIVNLVKTTQGQNTVQGGLNTKIAALENSLSTYEKGLQKLTEKLEVLTETSQIAAISLNTSNLHINSELALDAAEKRRLLEAVTTVKSFDTKELAQQITKDVENKLINLQQSTSAAQEEKIKSMGDVLINQSNKTRKEALGIKKESLEALENAKETLEKAQANNVTLTAVQEQHAQLVLNQSKTIQTINEIHTNVEKHAENLTEIHTKVNKQDQKLTEIQTNVENHDQNLTEILSNVENQDQKLSQVQGYISEQGNALETLEGTIKDQNKQIYNLDLTQQHQGTQLQEMATVIKSVKEDHITFAAEVRSKLNSMGDQISELKTHVTNRFNQAQAPLIRGAFAMIRNVNEDNRKITLEASNTNASNNPILNNANNNNQELHSQLNNNTTSSNSTIRNMVINPNPLTSSLPTNTNNAPSNNNTNTDFGLEISDNDTSSQASSDSGQSLSSNIEPRPSELAAIQVDWENEALAEYALDRKSFGSSLTSIFRQK